MYIILKIKKLVPTFFITSLIVLMIIFSDASFETAKSSFSIWLNNIVPSLFPFLICIDLIKKTYFIEILGKILSPIVRPLFNVPRMRCFCNCPSELHHGYPVGAKLATELYKTGKCNKVEAERLLAFTNTSGPLFIIGSVGVGLFNSKPLGFILLATHFLASLTVGIIFKNYKKNSFSTNHNTIIPQDAHKINKNEQLNSSNFCFYMINAIKSSALTLLMILGYVIFFSIILELLKKTGIILFITKAFVPFASLVNLPLSILPSIFSGIIEMTNGIVQLSSLSGISYEILYSSVAFLLGTAGISVLMQVYSILYDSGLSIKPYIIGKILHGTIAYIYTYFVIKHTNLIHSTSLEAFNYSGLNSNSLINQTSLLISCLSLVILIGFVVKCLVLLKKLVYYIANKNK